MGKLLHNRVNRNELRKKVGEESIIRTTLSFYTYTLLDDPGGFRDRFFRDLDSLGVLGRIYIAHEGINAQISVPSDHLDHLREYLDSYPFLKNIRLNMAVED